MQNTKQLIETTTPMAFVEIVKEPRELNELEFYALMVTDNSNRDSPYIKGYEPTTVDYLVGIEKTSGLNGWYISKNYNARKNSSRGLTVIVKVNLNELDKYTVLK